MRMVPVLVLALALAPPLALGACDQPPVHDLAGDSRQGRRVIARMECGVCHAIPGVPGSRGRVGPSLDGFARRAFIAGSIPNQPEYLVRWVRDAPSLRPETGMPRLDLTEQEARDVAAYLYTLR